MAKKVKKKGPRISKSPKKFNTEINRMDDRLQAVEPVSGNPYWQEYGFSNVNGSDFHNKRLFWSAPPTGLFAKSRDPKTSTTTVKGLVKTFIKDFRIFAKSLLNLVATAPISTSVEEGIFNLVLDKNRAHPSHTHTTIEDQCFTKWSASGGGNMKATSHTEHDAKGRGAVAEGSDGVQYATLIMDAPPEKIAEAIAAVVAQNLAAANARIANPSLPAPVPLPLPTAPPEHPDDGTKQEFFSGATKEFSFGADKKGKYLYSWSRFFNSKHPELASAWNARQVELIN
ncbi:MAG: hypothetical protein ACYDCN_12730 [Bacteroidia bacterium]